MKCKSIKEMTIAISNHDCGNKEICCLSSTRIDKGECGFRCLSCGQEWTVTQERLADNDGSKTVSDFMLFIKRERPLANDVFEQAGNNDV